MFAATVAGCGGSSAPPIPPQRAAPLHLSATEYSFSPSNPTVKPGDYELTLANHGKIAHSVAVEEVGGRTELRSDVQPGGTGTIEVDLSQPGTYTFYCPIANHRALGMQGTIRVR
jgi:plastocyanin